MKATLEFNLPHENEEFNCAIKGEKYKLIIDEIWQRCLRPNFKNGYLDEKLNTDNAHEIIGILAEVYNNILSEYNFHG